MSGRKETAHAAAVEVKDQAENWQRLGAEETAKKKSRELTERESPPFGAPRTGLLAHRSKD